MTKKKTSTVSHDERLREELRDPKLAAAYLNTCLEDSEQMPELLFLALREVAEAHGMADIAAKVPMNRVSVYKSLSPNGNPEFRTVLKLLHGMGLKMQVAPEDETSDRKKAGK